MSTQQIETAEEVHFLVRSGCWSAEDLSAWVNRYTDSFWFSSEENEEISWSDDGEEQKL